MSANRSDALLEPQPEAIIDNPRQRRAILIAVCIALMAVIASVSGLNVAQSDLAVEFGASQTEILWFINIYTITLSTLLLPLGAIGDQWGRRPMLLLGLAVFGVASAAAGMATSSEMMLAARLLSGVGAAMIMPITLAVVTSTFPEQERAKAIGVWTGVAGGGGILGMYLSALLVDLADWRWLFALPVALVAVAAAMTLRSVPNSREATGQRFDVVGAVTSALAVIGITFVLHEGPERGWTDVLTLASLSVGVLSGIVFVIWERRSRAPLLDVRLFRDRRLASGSVSLLTVFGVQAGIFVVVFPFFQVVLGWSGLRSTLALMPMALLMMLAAGVAPRLAPRIGSRFTMATGVLLGTGGLALMAMQVSVDGGYRSVLPGMLAMGFGMGLLMTPATDAITSALPRERQGVASALNDVTREFGTALGVALLGAILSAGYRSAMDGRLDGFSPEVATSAREGIASAIVSAESTGAGREDLIRIAQESFVSGWQRSMWSGAAVMSVLFVYVLVRGPQRGPAFAAVDESVETRDVGAVAGGEAVDVDSRGIVNSV